MNRTISNQLYHFTGYDKELKAFKPDQDAFSTLKRVVASGYLRLSPNPVEVHLPPGGFETSIKVDVHMACLTETPIEFISDHISKYGRFGLGFSVEWALKNGGLQVIYTDKDNPNSFAHTISELSDYFTINGMLAHDQRAIGWIAQLTAITERFELRDEREWRFLRASKMYDGYKGVGFSSQELQTVICPEKYVLQVREFLASNRLNPDVLATEKVCKQNIGP